MKTQFIYRRILFALFFTLFVWGGRGQTLINSSFTIQSALPSGNVDWVDQTITSNDYRYVIGNSFDTVSQNYDVWLSYQDTDGIIIWETFIDLNSGSNDYGVGIVADADDQPFIVAASSAQGSTDSDVYLLSLDALGQTLWTVSYDNGGDDHESDECC